MVYILKATPTQKNSDAARLNIWNQHIRYNH